MKTIDIADEDVNDFTKLMVRVQYSSCCRLDRYKHIIDYILDQLSHELPNKTNYCDSQIKNVK